MRKRLFIRLGVLPADADEAGGAGQVSWLRMAGATPVGGVGQGLLLEAASLASGHQIVVLVPAADVLLTSATVPTQNRQRMIRAVPYVMEDRLGDEVEHLHFALGRRGAANQIAVAVVDRRRMDSWQTALRQAGLQPELLVPETLGLPWREGNWFALQESSGVTLRTGAQSGLAVDNENLDAILAMALLEAADARPQALHLVVCGETLTALPDTLALPLEPPLEMSNEPCTEDPLLLLARGFDEQQTINLLQGDYSRREQLGKVWRPWRPAVGLLGAWLLLQGGMAIADVNRLNREAQALQPQIEQVYLKAFPESRKVVNPRVQMERGLEALRAAQGNGGGGFLGILQKSGANLQETPDMQLRSVSYREDELNLDLEIKDLQSLDQLKQQLAGESGLEVEIQSASSQEDKVQSRVQIRPKGAKAVS